MQKKYKVILIIIVLLFTFSCSILVNYRSYLQKKKDLVALVDVREGLSVNYGEGKYVVVNSLEREVSFSVTNLTTEKKIYTITLDNYTGSSDNVSYELMESGVQINNKLDSTGGSISNVTVNANETKRYTLKINNPLDKTFSFYINVSVDNADESFYSTILKNNDIKEANILGFDSSVTNSEGLIKKEEENGTSYYFRGSVNNNYVSLGDSLWRIVKINADGTVKMVLNSTTEEMVTFNTSDNKGNTSFENSNVYASLINWYNSHLNAYENFIASPNYCYDNSVLEDNGENVTYLSSIRLFTDYIPTNTCGGDSLSLKVGLLTADEVNFAGGSKNENKNYYLYLDGIESSWWTMTPSKKDNGELKLMSVSSVGALEEATPETSSLFLRPVISLNRKVSVTGSGTQENPYQVIE